MYNCMAQVWKWYDMRYGPAMGNNYMEFVWDTTCHIKPIHVNSLNQ